MEHALARHAVVVTLPAEVDLNNAPGLTEQLILAVSRHPIVIIDMSATRFCDSAGIHAIVRARKRATDSGAELRLVVTTQQVRRIFGLLGIDRVLEVYPSLEAARST